MKKLFLYLLALPLLILLLASCHNEEDDFIDKPDPKSLIIKGVARTSGGQPLSNIEVKLDFREASLVATKVRHKAKATTDKDGRYIMFFNLSDEEFKSLTTFVGDVSVSYNLQLTLDLTKLDDNKYLLPIDDTGVRDPKEKKLFYYAYRPQGGLQLGRVYEENIFIPCKQLVNVRVESNGTINEKDKFAVRNRVKYGLESQMPDQFDTEGGLVDFYRPVTLKNAHSQLIQVTCAVAEGSKIVLYRIPEGEYNYKTFSSEVEVPVAPIGDLLLRTY
ncbi:hypothetical protein J5A56_06965 [Prevotella melaninogenica]|uniref:hypothetical protein n=1 Tax=Prevotella TaxID=838 RepID=UPI0003FAA336|nr:MULTISPECIES: hypothetical protein [Prevotella]QUB74192.1 hypothetical protein J5A56_06965 [Prevotella melaninogenica]